MQPAEQGRYSRRMLALSFGGVAFVLVQLIVGTQIGLFPIPGRDQLIWDRVGDSLWTGSPIYYSPPVLADGFWYAPPLAVVFATISWLPIELQHWLFVVLRVASLRVIAGSWVGVGVACWFPLVAFDLGGGNFNLPIAASVVAAVNRRPELAVWGALAKFGPALAIDPRDWRRVVPVLAVALTITIPWLHLWPEYAGHLLANIGNTPGPQVPIPLPLRLAAATALLLVVRTGWARALAATLAIAAFYWGSLVVLLAPVAVFVRSRSASAPHRPAAVHGA
jgi:hypothetical protein